jgi:N-acetylglucosaminyldiphosphoundecaprenol N-acetyl-beta-D-mannosaminyltransferase
MKPFYILGVRIHLISFPTLKSLIEKTLKSKAYSPLFIATVNPSFILKSQKNATFSNILNNITTINTVDGVGVKMAYHYLTTCRGGFASKLLSGLRIGLGVGFFNCFGDQDPEVISGFDITKYLLQYANDNKYRVLFVIREDGLVNSNALDSYISDTYSKLKYKIIAISNEGNDLIVLKDDRFDIVICGHSEVKEEVFIANNIKSINPKIAIGVGGTFDLLTSVIKPSKGAISGIGFRWLFRLFNNPKRLRKTISSTIIFPIRVYLSSL